MISRLLKITGLFCRISSLLQGSFAKETYHFKEPTNRSHPIPSIYRMQQTDYTVQDRRKWTRRWAGAQAKNISACISAFDMAYWQRTSCAKMAHDQHGIPRHRYPYRYTDTSAISRRTSPKWHTFFVCYFGIRRRVKNIYVYTVYTAYRYIRYAVYTVYTVYTAYLLCQYASHIS